MKFYTIEKDTNNIAVHASVKEAQVVAGAERFSSETALTKVAAAWPQMARKPSVFLLLRGPVFRGVAWGASGPASRSHTFSASDIANSTASASSLLSEVSYAAALLKSNLS